VGVDYDLILLEYIIMKLVRLSLGALLLLCGLNAHAQIYKWVDENGNTQYTSQPPAALAKSEKKLNIKVRPAAKTDQPSSVAKNLADERTVFDERWKKKKEDKKKQKVAAAAKSKKCFHAQGRLKTYRDTARLTVPNGKGGIQYVDDKLRQKKIAAANKDIATYCG